MKYLYKGMQSVEEGGNCSVLLNWHEKVRHTLMRASEQQVLYFHDTI